MDILVKGKISSSFKFGAIIILFTLLVCSRTYGQLSGTKYIPGDYVSIKTAIIDLNAQGVAPGGVTFSIYPGFRDTIWSVDSTSINISLNRPGLSNPVVFQKYGFGNNPVIMTSSAGAGTYSGSSLGGFGDAIIRITGEDYITFDGIDLVDSYTGSSKALLIEYGFQILRNTRSDGCKNIQIKNCGVSLNGQYSYSQGIGILNYNGSGSSTNPRDYDGRHENIFIDGNTIQNVNTGIICLGYNHTTAPYYLYENNIQAGSASGNAIILPGGSGSASYGLYFSYADSIKINTNNISGTTGAVYGIYMGTGLNSRTDVTSNTISLTDTSLSGDMYCIYTTFGNSGTDNAVNISGNILQNCSFTTSSTGKFFGISNSGFPVSLTINSNALSGITYRSTSSGNFFGIYSSAGTVSNGISITGNIIQNINNNSTSAGSTYIIYNTSTAGGTADISGNAVNGITTCNASYNYLIAQNATANAFNINGNTINNVIKSGAYASGTIYGIYINSPTTPVINSISNSGNCIKNITSESTSQIFGIFDISDALQKQTNSDTIYNLSSTSGNYVYGIYYYNGTENHIGRNSVHDLHAGGSAAFTGGISVPSYVQNMYTYNNYVYSLNAPNSTLNPSVAAINIDGGSYHYLYYNTVFLDATGVAAGFSTAGLYVDANPNVEISNNIIINKSTPGSSGLTAAHRRKGISLSTFMMNSNNNNYYAGVPSSKNLIFFDGTSSDQTISSYKTRMLPKRESVSFTENTVFMNVLSHPYDLHLNNSAQTLCESGGKRITSPVSVINDWDTDRRWGESGYTGTGTAPDIGADEGEFTPSIQMSYISSTTGQTSGYVYTGSRNQEILRIEIITTGISNALTVSGFTVNANGTTDTNDINKSEARIYYTAGSGIFDTSTVFGQGVPTIENFYVAGLQNLAEGTNYFWLAYDISSTAQDGNAADGECISIDISGIPRTPAVTAPPEYKTIAGLMSGNYYVGQGQSLPNFTTLTQAFHNAENRGVCGPVTFLLTNPVSIPYNAANGENIPLVLNTIPGASLTNTITVKPNTGNQSVIADNSSSTILKFYGADFITFDGSNNKSATRDLVIANLSTSGNTSAIWFTSLGTGQGATNNTVTNCNIYCGTNTSATYSIFAGGAIFGQGGSDNDYLAFSNNYIGKSMYGIYLYGNAQTSDHCTISANTIGALSGSPADYISYFGIYTSYYTNTYITGNTVRNIIGDMSGKKGIYIGQGTLTSRISENEIYGIKYTGTDGSGAAGLYVNTGNASSYDTIANNIIYDIKADGYSGNTSSEPYGIVIEGNTGRLSIFFNTVNLYGDISNGGSGYTATPASILINSTSNNIDIRNNVFINSMTKESAPSSVFYAIYSLSPSSAFFNINYNDYYTECANGILGYLGSNRYTIANWRTATGKDANSFNLKPRINSNTNLRPQPLSPLLSAGTPIENIPYDISGVQRNVIAPTIGAYETLVDFAGPDIVFQALPDTSPAQNRTTNNFARITDPNGINSAAGTAPRIYYKKNWHLNAYSDNASSSNGWKWVEGFFCDTCWNFTIDYSLLYGGSVSAGEIIQYFVVAQDTLETPNVSLYRGLPARTPVNVNLQPADFPVTGNVYSYSLIALQPLAGDYTVGLTVFNMITGLNLKSGNHSDDNTASDRRNFTKDKVGKKELFREKAKDKIKYRDKKNSIILDGNGKEYAGPLYIPFTKELRAKHNLSDRLTGAYANITSAVNDLNNAGISASVRFLLTDALYGTFGTPENFPIRINRTGGASSLATVTIQPQTGTSSIIQGEDNHAIFDLNGAGYINIDGRMNGNTTGKDLIIRNTNSTFDSTSVIRFINDARRNTVQYCNIEGNSTSSAAGGLIFFSTTNGQYGNDSNLIQYNDIRDRSDAAGNYRYGIYSYGSNTAAAANNSDNVVSGNNIYNFWQNDAMSAGIYLYYGTGDNWIITGNSFFQTVQRTFSTTSMTGWNVIYTGYQSINNISISENYIGGTAANCGGSPWNAVFSSSGNYSRFYGIAGITGVNIPGNIQGNIIQNISLNFDVTAMSYGYVVFAPILMDLTGSVNIGTAAGNTIGNNSGNGNISVIFSGTSSYIPVINGIEHRSEGNISNNNIGSFNLSVSGTLANGYEFNGISRNSVSSGNPFISNNTIGSSTLTGSITHSGSNSALKFSGIKSETNSGTVTINGNTVANIISNSVLGSSFCRGVIHTGQSAPSITGNTIHDIYSLTENENTLSSLTGAVSGIVVSSPSSDALISGNVISSLRSGTSSPKNTIVTGICVNNSSSAGSISRNRIYNLENTSTGTAPGITGINNYSGSWSVSNNQITILNGETLSGYCKKSDVTKGKPDFLSMNTVQIYGIYDNSSSPGSYYYNTVYTGGTVSSGSLNSYCLYRNGTSNITVKNNLLYNNRQKTGTASGYNYVFGSPVTDALTSNSNAYVTTDTMRVFRFGGSSHTFAQWKSSTSNDRHSYSASAEIIPYQNLFASTAEGNLSIKKTNKEAWFVSGKGAPLTGYVSDFDSESMRTEVISGGVTDIGSDEFNETPPECPFLTETSVPAPGTFTSYVLYGRTICTIYWNTSGTSYPSGMNMKYYSGINPPNSYGNFAKFYIDAEPSGSLAGTTYDMTIFFSPGETYLITNPPTDTRLCKYSSGSWISFTALGTDTLQTELDYQNYFARVRGLSSFSYFTLTDVNVPLPIALESFKSAVKGRDVMLTWLTQSETNITGFEIQRNNVTDTNNGLWEKAGYIKSAGTGKNTYEFRDIKLGAGRYLYRLKQTDYQGNSNYFYLPSPAEVSLPDEYFLSQNYPNPFNPDTKIDFSMPSDGRVNITVYDIVGREIKTIINESRKAGYHTVKFRSVGISSGTYFYRMTVTNNGTKFMAAKKMTVVK